MKKQKIQRMFLEIANAIEDNPLAIAFIKNDIVVRTNASFDKICGNDAVGKTMENLFEPKATDQLRWLMEAPVIESDKIVLSLIDGNEVMVEFWPLNKNILFLILRHEYSLDRLADIDELTGLANRRKARMLLKIETARVDRQQNFCLAIGDIDFFKKVNDVHGHNVGDDVLRHVSRVIQSGLRRGDWAARWGGEEFLIYINDSDLVTGMQPVERIRQMLSDTPFAGPPEIAATMSFGLVSSEQSGGDMNQLVNAADVLLYDAKRNGRNRVELGGGKEKIWVIDYIREAINEHQIEPQYLSVCNWKNETAAIFLKPGLRNGTKSDIDNMLKAADRLDVRHEVECEIINVLTKQLSAHADIPHILPVSNEMFEKNGNNILNFFKRFPYVKAGLSAERGFPPEKTLEKLIREKIEVAILDFSPRHNGPVHLISHHTVSHIFYNTPDTGAKHLIDFTPDSLQFYATIAESERVSEKKKKFLKDSGFLGIVRDHG